MRLRVFIGALSTTTEPPAASINRLSATYRSAHVEMSSAGPGANGHGIRVELHAVGGRLHALEVIAGDAGDGVTVDLYSVTALEVSEIG